MKKRLNELLVYEDSKSPISEVIRVLRTNIQFNPINKDIKTLLITSATPGDGKSLVSANLATAFAQAGNKVLLVDADLRKGRQNKIFKLSNVYGFSDILLNDNADKLEKQVPEIVDFRVEIRNKYDKIINDTFVQNLQVITSGKVPHHPSELLASEAMKKFIEDKSKGYDIVIFDGPPANGLPDSMIMSTLVDAVILVAAVKNTEMRYLEKAKRSIEGVGGKIIGVVVNKMPILSRKEYKKYYGYSRKEEEELE